MTSRTCKNLTRLFFLTALMTVGGVSTVFAQLQMQNLTVPGFICPGQALTITFQAQVDANNVQPQVAGVLSTVSATSFSNSTDKLFLYSGGNNTAPKPAPWAAGTYLDNAFTLVPAGNLTMATYTWTINPVPAYATGTVVYVNISGGESSNWADGMNMTSDAHLSVAVTVNCNNKALNNTGIFGGSSSTAPLVIIGGATSTFTNTPTNTISPTVTNTPLPANTSTFTNTFTPTPTNTYTSTATNTLSPTVTNTPVDSFTFTNTFTITPTNTLTNTPTSTYSPTITNTPADTFTFTNTFTPTPSGTFTNTPQFTFTFTNTPTPTTTNTFTVTPTPTAFVGFGKTVSETQANAGDVLTYTIAVTVTGPSLTNPVITDTLPANMTFQTFGSMPAGTTTNNANLPLLQWTLPPTLADGVYDITYQTKVNSFAPANVPLTNNAQLTYAGGGLLKASVPVTVIGQFSVAVNIYNGAGEVIKTIPIQQFSTAVNNIVLSTTNTISTLTGSGSTIEILYNGYVIGTWNGTNNANQPVSNGSYRVQIASVSAAGVVTSVSQTAIVNRNLSSVEVDIYNGAGEIVRKLYNVVDNATDSNMTNVILSTALLKPNASNIPSNAGNSQLQILVQDTNSPVTLTWDGTTNGSTYVTPGQYEIQVHWTNGSGTTTDITRTVMVLPVAGVSGTAAAIPNVLGGKNGTTTTFNAMGVLNASSLKVKIFTIAGELVESFTSGTPTATWNAAGLASGIYIAVLEIDNANGGIVNQQRLKILVIH